jgi:Reverse transcriptase (RNA-dependent DNA polymerase)
VFALDFSEAFDSVRHSAVIDKFSKLLIADNIYNWAESFFRSHSHCTKFGQDISGFKEIMASIIQGSCIEPASYVVTASDVHPVTEGNSMDKYADDTYLIVPASNFS